MTRYRYSPVRCVLPGAPGGPVIDAPYTGRSCVASPPVGDVIPSDAAHKGRRYIAPFHPLAFSGEKKGTSLILGDRWSRAGSRLLAGKATKISDVPFLSPLPYGRGSVGVPLPYGRGSVGVPLPYGRGSVIRRCRRRSSPPLPRGRSPPDVSCGLPEWPGRSRVVPTSQSAA